MSSIQRTPVRQIAKQFAKSLRKEYPDYSYLKELFRQLRQELQIEVTHQTKKLSYVPTEEEISRYYKAVWQVRNMKHVLLIKVLLYTGVRVGELVKIELSDVDYEKCQIHIAGKKGKKDRKVPFPNNFREVLALHVSSMKEKGAKYLFESSWKRPYSDRGVRKILAQYSKAAGIKGRISPQKLRYFLFAWMKRQGIENPYIQAYSGHEKPQSLDVYSKLSIEEAQKEYDHVITKFPV